MTTSRRSTASAQKVTATDVRSFRTFMLMQQFVAQEIGARIAQARREAGGMTQDQLAELLNVSKRSLQDYESGTTIPWKYFQVLQQVFERPLDWFLHGDPKDGSTANHDPDQLQAVLALVEEMHGWVRELRELVEARLAELPQSQPGEPPAQSGS
jgi:transcriptional regulator with XRE-family HTH domain